MGSVIAGMGSGINPSYGSQASVSSSSDQRRPYHQSVSGSYNLMFSSREGLNQGKGSHIVVSTR
jgi:hypothetical protein